MIATNGNVVAGKHLILHIGLSRCSSTGLQRKMSLIKRDHYATSPIIFDFDLAASLAYDLNNDIVKFSELKLAQYMQSLEDQNVEQVQTKPIVLSAEYLGTGKAAENLGKLNLFPGYEICVIAFVRPILDRLISAHFYWWIFQGSPRKVLSPNFFRNRILANRDEHDLEKIFSNYSRIREVGELIVLPYSEYAPHDLFFSKINSPKPKNEFENENSSFFRMQSFFRSNNSSSKTLILKILFFIQLIVASPLVYKLNKKAHIIENYDSYHLLKTGAFSHSFWNLRIQYLGILSKLYRI